MLYLECNKNRKRVKKMKKLNAKGFTLIELLAVITIMGILMLVAIPAVSRTIENSRKDTFLDTVGQYVNGASTMWAADNLYCDTTEGTSYVSSAVPNGTYYVVVDSSRTDVPQLLEKGGKSSWGSRHIKGYIKVVVSTVNAGTTKETRKITYYPVLTDNIHGVNVDNTGKVYGSTGAAVTSLKDSNSLVRGNVTMTGATYPTLASDAKKCVEN